MSYINFVDRGKSESGKTLRYEVTSKDGNILGRISWYSPWRRYVINTIFNAIFDSTCLKEISEFLDKLNKEHKTNDTET